MSAITHAFESLLADYGVPALFVAIFFETLGAPMPGESALILAAGAAGAGKLDIRAVVIAAYLGAVLGGLAGYAIGRHLGRPVVQRYGARIGIKEAAFDRAEGFVQRYGAMMVVAARFVVVVRQLSGLIAGTSGMHWATFFLANLVGAGLWVGLWTTVAYGFGQRLDVLPYLWHHLNLVAAIVVPALIVAALVLRLRKRRKPGPSG